MMATAANSAWLATSVPEHLRFRRALSRVREEQEQVLHGILRNNIESEFGCQHGFSKIRTVQDYRVRVPLRDYDEYRSSVDRIAGGHQHVLTHEPVRLFEPTSGSAGAAKWIPYTRSLQSEFQRGIHAWVADLFLHHPDLLRGPAYWSVSPAEAGGQRTPSGIPIGFADDSEYVGGIQRKLVQSVMAVPASVRKLRDMDQFWRTTLFHLVRCRDLRFISVWNPSFLTLLMERLPEHSDRLADDLPALKPALRAATAQERHRLLWPRLQMISCWTDSNSSAAARTLAALFPHVKIRGKGLIATEGFISLPWEQSDAAVLAVRSHFLEFLPVDSEDEPDATRPLLAHELECGRQYSVVLTTGGGLYRYVLGDVVQVVGHARQCPLVQFIARRRISDWCGEKLHEAHVSRILESAFAGHNIVPAFAMLACDTNGRVPNYVLYVEAAASAHRLIEIAAGVESGLQENFHYRYARRLGQLGPVRVFEARNAGASYLAAGVARNQRVGDVKAATLDPRDGWTERFSGSFVETRAAAGRTA